MGLLLKIRKGETRSLILRSKDKGKQIKGKNNSVPSSSTANKQAPKPNYALVIVIGRSYGEFL